MISNFTDEQNEVAARWGIRAAAGVTIASICANVYIMTTRAAEGSGGWGDLDAAGILNVLINAALAVGGEILGFVALGFVLIFAFRGWWIRCSAALAIFIIALVINMPTTHAFIMGQAQGAAERTIKRTEGFKSAEAVLAATPIKMTGLAPEALSELIKGKETEWRAARVDGRWADVKTKDAELSQARSDLAVAITLTAAVKADEAKRAIAAKTVDKLLKSAKPGKAAKDLADRTMWGVDLIKALGLLAFTLGDMRIAPKGRGKPADVPAAKSEPVARPAKQEGYPPKIVVRNGTTGSAKKGHRTEAQKAAQREYTRKWREGLKAANG